MGACVLHLKCFLTSSLFCPIRLRMLKISELCNPIGWLRVTHWRSQEKNPIRQKCGKSQFWRMGNGEKAKMNKMHRNDTSSIILPSRQTLPPLRQKNFAKANGDTEIIRNFAPDGHSVYGLWHVSVQRDKRYRSRLNFYEIQDLPLFLRRFGVLKRECSELYDRWKVKKRPKRKVKMECRRTQTPNQIFVRKVQTTSLSFAHYLTF